LLPRKAALSFLLGALPTGSFLGADSLTYHVEAGRKLPLPPEGDLKHVYLDAEKKSPKDTRPCPNVTSLGFAARALMGIGCKPRLSCDMRKLLETETTDRALSRV
jgi:hypothetical protein